LAQAQVEEVGSSRVSLSQTFNYVGGESRFVGYTAKISFHVLLRNLDKMEEILSGVVDAGANSIGPNDLHTSQLKELRAEARQRAVLAAREKAEIYCKSAGVSLGSVIHVEDVNPETMSVYHGHGEARTNSTPSDDEGTTRAINPESISVSAAVMLAFEIGRL
jgi:uncharacterized protein YggE